MKNAYLLLGVGLIAFYLYQTNKNNKNKKAKNTFKAEAGDVQVDLNNQQNILPKLNGVVGLGGL